MNDTVQITFRIKINGEVYIFFAEITERNARGILISDYFGKMEVKYTWDG